MKRWVSPPPGLSIDEIMAAMKSKTAVKLAELIRRPEKEFGVSATTLAV